MQDHKLTSRENLVPFMLVTALFLFWGFPSNMNDILIKQFMKSFELNRLEAGLVQSAYYIGYFLISIPAAMLMRRYSYKVGIVTGLLFFGLGTFLFYPAAHSNHFTFFLVALFVIATGCGFLETGANPFIARLGDPASSERRLNFSQAFNPVGAVLAVVIGRAFILSGVEPSTSEIATMKTQGIYQHFLEHETMRVVTPYLVLGTVVLIWAILILLTKFPQAAEERRESENNQKGAFRELLKYPHFIKGVIAQFFYVGAQVCTWSYYIQYIQDYTHKPEKSAAGFLVGTLVMFGLGRFSAAWIMKYFRPGLLMGIYGLTNVTLVAFSVLFPGLLGLWAIFFTSFFMSVMFPTIFALAIKGLGPNTKIGSSFLVMAIIGGAAFTPIMALVFLETKSMAIAMLVPLVCYLFITYYAFLGSTPRNVPVEA